MIFINYNRESDVTAYTAERSFHAAGTDNLQDLFLGSVWVSQFNTECLANEATSENKQENVIGS